MSRKDRPYFSKKFIKMVLTIGRLSRMVQDGIFFDPKAYVGTSRGQKNDK